MFFTTLATIALVLSFLGQAPQMARMYRTKQSGGQSVWGWVINAVAQLLLAAVNLMSLNEWVLGGSNIFMVISSLAGASFVIYYRKPRTEVAPETMTTCTCGRPMMIL